VALKRGLGRGIEALLPDLGALPGEAVTQLEWDAVEPNPYQPRRTMDPERLAELAASIVEHGMLEPIIVRRQGARYQIVAGERRWRAARLARLQSVPAVVRDLPERTMMEVALVENLQREDLTALEEAAAFRRLMEEFGYTQEDLARRVGRSRPAIANALRLLSLEPEIQEGVQRGDLSAGHARALLAVSDGKERLRLAGEVTGRGLSVREVERLARHRPGGPRAAAGVRTPEVSAVEERLMAALGTRVRVRPGRRRGVIEVEYFGDADLERILDLLERR
jgi:ParB family chromosome partitioning protein